MGTHKDRAKICPRTGQPNMKSWGIGEGKKPLTDDPENPFKPFAEYETEEEHEQHSRDINGRQTGYRKKMDY